MRTSDRPAIPTLAAMMSGMVLMRGAAGALGLVLILGASACGSGTGHPASGSTDGASQGGSAQASRGPGVSRAAAAVIEGWSVALRKDQQARAAEYWAQPSVMVNGSGSGQLQVIRIRSVKEAEQADETLSCGAVLKSTSLSGAYVRAVFSLSTRTGPGASPSGCSGPAAVDFLIADGHIKRWLRAPAGSAPPPAAAGSQSI